jgi:hypothetical protein
MVKDEILWEYALGGKMARIAIKKGKQLYIKKNHHENQIFFF